MKTNNIMKKSLMFLAALLLFAGCKSNEQTVMNKDFLTLATERYSVRSFSPTPVSQDNIDLIIKAGQIAPTAVNSQPQMVYVAKSEDVMAKLNEVSPCIYGAPHCFVFCYNDENVAQRGENGNYGDIDVTIVLTHMMLEAANLGIGTCIVGYYDAAKLTEALELPENMHPVLLMPFGYPSEISEPSEKHSSYRNFEETVKYL